MSFIEKLGDETPVAEKSPNGGSRPFFDLFVAEAPALFLILLFVGAVLLMRHQLGGRGLEEIFVYNRPFFVLIASYLLVFVIGYCIYVMLIVRPDQLTRYLLSDFTKRYLTRERIVSAAIVLMALLPFMSAFTLFKTSISVFHPFAWDETFAELDRALHGGVQPWELLHPVLGYPLVTAIINHIYHAWFFVLFGFLFFQAFQQARPQLRLQFFLSFLLCWIVVGSMAALYFSSAGPVYYERLFGEDAGYRELFTYLQVANDHFPILALEVQEKLWSTYIAGTVDKGAEISAMPSMHVAMAALFVMLSRHYGRTLFILACVFCFSILLGSIHLGWHYAVDGYVSIALVPLIWWLAGLYASYVGRNNSLPGLSIENQKF